MPKMVSKAEDTEEVWHNKELKFILGKLCCLPTLDLWFLIGRRIILGPVDNLD